MILPTIDDVRAAAIRIKPYVFRTPLVRNDVLDALVGAKVFLKAECLQRFGAFKARGAFNKLAKLDPDVRARGVVAFSSGNHAQAVAGAAKHFAVPAVIVMPADAPRFKIEGTKRLGGEVVLYDRVNEDREAIGRAISEERGLTLVKPFDDPDIIEGQGTAGLEIGEDIDGLDAALICASGGGLMSGCAIALKARFLECAVYGVEPDGHDDFARSLEAGVRVKNAPGIRSICDALMSEQVGEYPFALAKAHDIRALSVSDEEVRAAMRFAAMELKLFVEPGGAVGLAALLAGRIEAKGKRIAVVLSGGNVDAEMMRGVLG